MNPSPPDETSALLRWMAMGFALATIATAMGVWGWSTEKEIRTLNATKADVPRDMLEVPMGIPFDPTKGLVLFTPEEIHAVQAEEPAWLSDFLFAEGLTPGQSGAGEILATLMTHVNGYALFRDRAEVSDEGMTRLVERTRQQTEEDLSEILGQETAHRLVSLAVHRLALADRLDTSIQSLKTRAVFRNASNFPRSTKNPAR